MGVSPPSLEEFQVVIPPALPSVSSPQEGVIVLEPPVVIDEQSGRQIDPEAPIEPGIEVITQSQLRSGFVELQKDNEQPTKPSQKKSRPKKDD